jgi:hypothetical protein
MDWIKIGVIIAANLLSAGCLMYWSGKEGREFRKKLKAMR